MIELMPLTYNLGATLIHRTDGFKDLSGNGIAITNSNAIHSTDHLGQGNKAIRCAAASSAKVVYPNTLIRNKQKLTLCYGVKLDSGTNLNVFTNRAVGSIANVTGALHLGANVNNFYVNDANTNSGTFTLSNVGIFNHYCWIYDGTLTGNENRLKLILNGIERTLTFAGTIPAGTTDLDRELSTGFYNNAFLTGEYSGLLYFVNKALGVSECQRLYREWAGGAI